MTLDSGPYKREEIYNNHLQDLQTISGRRFTLREMDIISCSLHNRSNKKIAALLSITHRAVESHMRNIFTKGGYSSRDQIIDVVEKSGKLHYVRQYYFHLIIQSAFEQQLRKIGALINRRGITCSTDFSKTTDTDKKLLEQIQQDLKFANVNLIENQNEGADIQYKFNLYPITRTSAKVRALSRHIPSNFSQFEVPKNIML